MKKGTPQNYVWNKEQVPNKALEQHRVQGYHTRALFLPIIYHKLNPYMLNLICFSLTTRDPQHTSAGLPEGNLRGRNF